MTTSSAEHLRRNQILVSVAAVVWLVGTALGTGLVGEGVSQQAQGLFSDHATLIAPHGPAFSIWSVIYLGLTAYILWQWWPSSADSPWAARTRLPAAAAIALNGLWLLVVQVGLVWLSVIVMVGIVISLRWVINAVKELTLDSWITAVVIPVTFGLYLGWICVATCANIATYLVGLGVPVATTLSTWITVVVLATVVGLAVYLLRTLTHRATAIAFAAAVSWGASWVAVGRSVGQLQSDVVAWAAGATAIVVALACIAQLLRGSWNTTRAAA